ncbi:hypothetical protein [Edaphobacter aggregans]|nr:hypothetical protein [Edaphobacter aggregans]
MAFATDAVIYLWDFNGWQMAGAETTVIRYEESEQLDAERPKT